MHDPTAILLDIDPRVQRMRGTAAHGNTPFDVPYISEIAENFWVGGCTNGLRLPSFVEHLISLYPWESYDAVHEIKSMLAVVMYDADNEPDTEQVFAVARWVNACRAAGPTLLHCQAGLNRSNLVAAAALIIDGGMFPVDAVDLLREKRSPAVLCNPSFERWVMGLR